MKAFLALTLLAGASAHGVMYEPPTRNALGMNSLLRPGCPGGSCLWFNQGCTIGCPKATGGGSVFPAKPDCDKPAEATIGFKDHKHRTVNMGLAADALGDWTKYHPWRKPGSAPVEDSCGLAGGWYTQGQAGNGGDAPPGVPQGAKGSELPKLLNHKTTWIAGETAEVAWSIYANHGGGYAYRLCPADQKPTEACFQAHHLEFVGDKQWIQFGNGMDMKNRTTIKAVRVNNGTVPEGSSWTRNPIPACADVGKNTIGLGAFNTPCHQPQFEPPIKGVFGFGGGSCGSSLATCTPNEFNEHSFKFGVVDKVRVPKLPAGDYVLSFRWDSEQTPQVWSSCADVTIAEAGQASTPFVPYSGCETCCEETRGFCSNCTACVDKKDGACEYCWKPLKGYDPNLYPALNCLGWESADGGPTVFEPGMPIRDQGWSPGCTKCWKDNVCKKAA